MCPAVRLQHHERRIQAMFSLLLLLWLHCVSAKEDQNKDFCRRFSHRTTVIGDRLYIDGGYVNYKGFPGNPRNYSNGLLVYHDLSTSQFELKTDLEPKPDNIPIVAGGVLWPDSVNNRFYLYGGEQIGDPPAEYTLLSYDTSKDKWNDHGEITPKPTISSFGAGVGVSETGRGYYCGGWISNASMSGWPNDRTMSLNCYSYKYDEKEFEEMEPFGHPRAEGGMVWIPAGDAQGLLVYMGGVVSLKKDGVSPQPLSEILIFDPTSSKWYTQNTTGQEPQNRRQFCMDVAWAPDKSSFNIYVFAGQAVYPPLTNATAYSDVYVLSIPSFIWVKIDPDSPGNATGRSQKRYGSSCNMVKHMSQLAIIGGTFTEHDNCSLDVSWGAANLWTGKYQDDGFNTYWKGFNETVSSNTVPADIYDAIGGDRFGSATAKKPENGWSNPELERLFDMEWNDPGRKAESKGSKLSTGAIVGIAVGGAAVLALILYAWYRFGKSVLQRREQRRQSQVMQQAQQMQQVQQEEQAKLAQQMQQAQHTQLPHQSIYGGSTVGTQSLMSPQSPPSHWVMASAPASPELQPPMEPMELPADHDNSTMGNKPPAYEIGPHL